MELVTLSCGGTLDAAAAASWERMIAAGMSATKPTSTYRSTASQRAIFLARYQTTKVAYAPGKYDRRVYNGVAYYRKPGYAAVAVPGTSVHEQGRAVDANNAQVAWLTMSSTRRSGA